MKHVKLGIKPPAYFSNSWLWDKFLGFKLEEDRTYSLYFDCLSLTLNIEKDYQWLWIKLMDDSTNQSVKTLYRFCLRKREYQKVEMMIDDEFETYPDIKCSKKWRQVTPDDIIERICYDVIIDHLSEVKEGVSEFIKTGAVKDIKKCLINNEWINLD